MAESDGYHSVSARQICSTGELLTRSPLHLRRSEQYWRSVLRAPALYRDRPAGVVGVFGGRSSPVRITPHCAPLRVIAFRFNGSRWEFHDAAGKRRHIFHDGAIPLACWAAAIVTRP